MKKSTLIDQATAQELQNGALAAGDLLIWTLYRSPKDFPGLFIGRPHATLARGGAQALLSHLEAPSLDELRKQLPIGLIQLDRQSEDEPHIVEVWL